MPESIWFKKDVSIERINKWCENTAVDNCGIEITEVGPDYIIGTMPVDHRTVQPQRRLHGGVSCVLAESLGSIAANMVLDSEKEIAFGQSINANHTRPAAEGKVVTGKASPIHLGRTSQVWEIKITDGDRLVCISRLTMVVVKK